MISLDAEDEVSNLHSKVDLVITLGGDGTVLWVHLPLFFFPLSDPFIPSFRQTEVPHKEYVLGFQVAKLV